MRFLIFSVLLLSSLGLVAQDYEAPVLHCLQVNAAGEVDITWQAVSDPSSEFQYYELWRVPEDIAPTTLAQLPINTTTYNDIGVLPISQIVRYYVDAVYDSSGVEIRKPSAILKTINPATNVLGAAIVSLNWERPIYGDDSLMYTEFEVQMNYTGVWQTLFTQNYSDTSAIYVSELCPLFVGDSIEADFRIALEDIFGCTSTSSIREDRKLIDPNPPTPPSIETVSYDTASAAMNICWFPSPEGDVAGYWLIYEPHSNGADEIPAEDPTTDPAITSQLDFISNGPDYQFVYDYRYNSVGYNVLVFDSCGGNVTTIFESDPHYSIHLELDFKTCDQTTTLSWSPYVGWEGGVDYYVAYGGLFNGGAVQWEALDTIPGDQTNYQHVNVPLDVEYSYLIKAESVNGFKPSLSQIQSVETLYPALPAYTYLANVSVVGNKQVELKALVDPAAATTSYRFEKLDRFGDQFDPLLTLPQESVDMDNQLTMTDIDAFPNTNRHQYRVVSIDSCGNEYTSSDISSNILAQVQVDSDARSNVITWSSYRHWEGEILGYNLYELENGQLGPLLAALPPDVFRYEHSVDSLIDYLQNAQYCYIIEAVEGFNPFGPDQLSYSNIVCATQEPLIFIPNAFTPNGDGINDTFGAVAGYFDRNEGFNMFVYNRWGELIYETDSYYKPWTGEDGNGVVQEGLYKYYMTFRTGGGEFFERYGNIAVLIAPTE